MDPTPWTPSTEEASSYSQTGPSGPSSYFPQYSNAEAGPSTYSLDSPQASTSASQPDPHLPFQSASYSYDMSVPPTSSDSEHIKQEYDGDVITAAALPARGRGSRGGPGSRGGRGRGSRGRGSRGGRGGIPGGGRSSSRVQAKAEAAAAVASQGRNIKLTIKGQGLNQTHKTDSFLGGYDRMLDENPEEPLYFEEQFILRVPREVAEGKDGLRERVKKGGLDGVEFKFFDSRRAAFKINGTTYASRLVDLPCIIESQKTLDNQHLFKVADISQMLLVEKAVKDESTITKDPLIIDDYIWPHGITPPLRHVRKRRFRKRLSRQTIEVVEEKVDELLKAEEGCESVETMTIEAHANPNIGDDYYENYVEGGYDDYGPEHYAASEAGESFYEDPGSTAPTDGWGEEGYDDGESYVGDEQDDFDQELAAALADDDDENATDAQSDEDGMSGEEEDDDEEGDKSEGEDDEETAEQKAKIKQLTSEIKALEAAIERKRATFTKGNAIMEKRFNETMKGLEDDVKMKADARQVLIDEIEEAEAEKRGPMSADRAGTIDVDDVGTRAGTPAFTPGITPAGIKSSGVNTDVEMDEDDDDDLFGDATGDEADGESAAGTPMLGGEQTDAEGEDDNEPTDGAGGDHGVNAQPDEDDEMAMMLQMELEAGGLNEDDAPPPPSSQAGTPGAFDLAGVDEQTQADATAALESFAMTGGMEADGAGMMGAGGAGGFGSVAFGAVEGGVGMRRLASGARADDDSSDDDSDD